MCFLWRFKIIKFVAYSSQGSHTGQLDFLWRLSKKYLFLIQTIFLAMIFQVLRFNFQFFAYSNIVCILCWLLCM